MLQPDIKHLYYYKKKLRNYKNEKAYQTVKEIYFQYTKNK